MVAIVLNSI